MKLINGPIPNRLFGGWFDFFTEQEIFTVHLRQLKGFKFRVEIYNVLLKVWESGYWRKKGFDGKSIVKDTYAARLGSFLHDGPSRLGYGGKEGDLLFLYIELKTSRNKWQKIRAYIEWFFCRIGSQYFIIRDLIKGTRKDKPEWLIEIYLLIKTKAI
jgi:hypothetical protein